MSEPLRLSKRMSELGLCSRREADEWIERGWVLVDGLVIKELGTKILPTQHITIKRSAASEQARRVTVLLNKPVGYVSGQAEDGHQPAYVLVKPENRWSLDRSTTEFEREQLRSLVPAGRLDMDSVGLLVLTQDGRIAKELIGEDSHVEKEYLVRVSYTKPGRLPDSDLKKLNHGLWMDGLALHPAKVRWINEDQLSFILREGRKRQIRRMCDMVGLTVLSLKRVRIGKVTLGDLPEGQWRYLGNDEIFSSPYDSVKPLPKRAPRRFNTPKPAPGESPQRGHGPARQDRKQTPAPAPASGSAAVPRQAAKKPGERPARQSGTVSAGPEKMPPARPVSAPVQKPEQINPDTGRKMLSVARQVEATEISRPPVRRRPGIKPR